MLQGLRLGTRGTTWASLGCHPLHLLDLDWVGFFSHFPSRAFPTKQSSFQLCKLPPYYPISQLQLLKSWGSDSVADYSNLFAILIVLFSISSGCLNLMIGLLHVLRAVTVVIEVVRQTPTDLS